MSAKKGIVLGLAFILIFSLFALATGYSSVDETDLAYTQDNNVTGAGTPGDPYMIHNVWELQDMNSNRSAHYALANDIDASQTSGWNGGAGFVPIGDYNNQFTGSLDGRNHTIMGLYINRPTTDFVGLIGWLDGEVANVGLSEANIVGDRHTGGLAAGTESGAHISNSFVIGNIGGGDYVGGLVGRNYGAIETSFTEGHVNGNAYVGGLVGENQAAVVYSYAEPDVLGVGSWVGGLIGQNNGGTVSDSYARGNATTDGTRVGGLVGRNVGSITNTYSTGVPTGDDSVGGLVGLNDGDPVTTSFWDVDTSGTTVSDGGTGLSTEEMQTESTFTGAGWDFENIWWMIEGETYPLFWWQTVTEPPSIELFSPTGGETWDASTEQNISWSTTAGDGEITGIDIDYSTDGGVSWTNIVTGYNHGFYIWNVPDEHTTEAQVRVTVHDDHGTSGTNTSANFNIVGIPPEAPTNLNVEHHGTLNETLIKTMYMRSDQQTVNGFTGYRLEDIQSDQAESVSLVSGNNQDHNVVWGIRVFVRKNDGSEIEISQDVEAVVERPAGTTGSGHQTATFALGSYELDKEDSIVVRVYGDLNMETPIEERCEFTTSQLSADVLEGGEWTVNYYTERLYGGTPSRTTGIFRWGTNMFNSRIEDFSYTVAGEEGTENNLLTWNAGADDPDKVTHYQVYRSETETGIYEHIATVSADGSDSYQYIDANKGTADEILWWYQVYSDTNGQYSDESIGPVQEPGAEEEPEPDPTFDILLTSGGAANGWNFVSFNLDLADTNLETILAGIDGSYSKVMYYDAAAGQWQSYVPGRAAHYNNIDTWNHHMGLWIHATVDDTLTVEGSAPVSTDITLYPGWNMVGLPSSTVGNHGLPEEVDKVGYFDATAEYNLAYSYTPETFTFEAGNGYWVHNPTEGNLIWNVEY